MTVKELQDQAKRYCSAFPEESKESVYFNAYMQGFRSRGSIYRIAREMRDAQKAYFRTRDKEMLVKAKQKEKDLDKLLEEYDALDFFSQIE